MGGKAWRTAVFQHISDDASGRSDQREERRGTPPRALSSAPAERAAEGRGNAGGRRWVTRPDDLQFLRSMAIGSPAPPLRGRGRLWAAPVDYTEPDDRRERSA
jgi:hypothetical protein